MSNALITLTLTRELHDELLAELVHSMEHSHDRGLQNDATRLQGMLDAVANARVDAVTLPRIVAGIAARLLITERERLERDSPECKTRGLNLVKWHSLNRVIEALPPLPELEGAGRGEVRGAELGVEPPGEKWEVEEGWEMVSHAIAGHGVAVTFADIPLRLQKGDHVLVLRKTNTARISPSGGT